ncbi:hypothetical protein QNN03_00445 [Streptomyces sp. GXMU-J15]|uniref:ATP synthase subunit E n=1 Tax=Streptomyces fuscus TaxID=3048495 RepID=A0ABT7IQN9_9ACTN|nr:MULTISPECIES: hypothetical protein [Streptomyces]MDL2074900.1 hypothetical protein [Streptomyces fuscus]SBT93432.1 hypothetical protein GA0115233_106348 [Streptomyces sp. DI166]
MKTSLPAPMTAALEPVRARLLRAAEADAAAMLATADKDAATILRQAEAQAADLLAEARERGAADAEAVRRAAHVRARRTARARELAARRECWEELRRQVIRGVEALRTTEGYPRIEAGLTARAHRLLGPRARISPAPGGGVLAEDETRRVDLSLTQCARRALDGAGPEVEELWTP